jgi:pimeloyl-ACP methyl ester carboxylesterase
LVQALCNAGVASMRVERGGMGDSTGIACTELDFAAELATYRSAAEALLADSRVATVSVFGHSYGGMVAPLLAELPVSRLAVVGTTALRWEQSVLSAARIVYEQSGLSAAQVKAKVRALTELGHCVYRNGMTPDEARSARPEAAGVVPEWYRGERLAGRKVQFYRQLNELDLGEAWRRVQRPVLALAGSDDFVCPPPQARRIAELCSGRARVIDGLGHELGDASGISGALSHALCSWFATS